MPYVHSNLKMSYLLDRFYPETRYDNRYPDYRHDNRFDNRYPDYRYDNRYDNRYAPGVGGSGNYGVYGPGSAYRNALVSNVDRRFYRGYNPYYNEAWRRNFYDPYYDQHGPYFLNYGRDGRAYGERLPYHPYGNDYFYRPDRYEELYIRSKSNQRYTLQLNSIAYTLCLASVCKYV